ncbi:histidine phosphatase family protein [Pseudoalteromonas ulvae]|uniref:Histidine phosphatase family protein n=1 Tax=Pseudoalteromonas ulvae TaxID=107327 RepID=A0A244CVL8_PSEDV|nr:histidine phosphatase family protein [Pseudoalteromonas ulvae]OUL59476.1 hypothetical protein B1199_04195 [Pseudoalteromonas ulvae]
MKKSVLFMSVLIQLLISHVALAKPETITLLRHSEKLTGSNPSLSDIGQKRAQSLIDELSSKAVTHIFSTRYHRTEQTAAPLALARNLTVRSYDPRELTTFAEQLLAMDGHIVVVGHSNTTPKLASYLADYPADNWSESEFNTYVELVSVKDGFKASEKQMEFGQTQP